MATLTARLMLELRRSPILRPRATDCCDYRCKWTNGRAADPRISSLSLGYDARGRVSDERQGARTLSFTYDAQGYLASITGPLLRLWASHMTRTGG
jgi:YD repeat-containing protein